MARWHPAPHLDPSELERGIDRASLRRAWAFARPYRGLLGLQLAGLAGTAVMGILPPLVLKALIDRAVGHRLSTGGVNVLVLAAVAIAVAMTALGLLNRYLGSRIGEGLLVKLFGRPGSEAEEFSQRAAAVRESGVRLAVQSRLYYGSLATVGAVGTAAVYWIGGRGLVNGSLRVGTLTALAAYVSRLYSPLTDLASARVDLLTALVSFERVFEVLDTVPAVDDLPGATAFAGPVEGRLDV